MSGNTNDGILRRSLEVHCRNCGEAYLGLAPTHVQAASELAQDGWGKRDRRWCCYRCVIALPRGHKFTQQVPA